MSANDEINRKSLEFIVCEIVDSKTRQSAGITEIFVLPRNWELS